MTDFDTEEYKNMLCIEPGHVAEKIYLKSNEKISLSQELTIV
jgi:D-hexose-6-phosphate mutarotase